MTTVRRYAPEPLAGEPVEFRTVGQARKLIGKSVEYTEIGWLTKREGVVQDVSGKNIMIDGDWRWRPSIVRMTVLP